MEISGLKVVFNSHNLPKNKIIDSKGEEKMADESREKRPYVRKASTEAQDQVQEKKEELIAKSEVERMIAEAVAKAMANVQQTQPQTVVINNAKDETVTLLCMETVAKDSTVPIGKLGEIQGWGGTRDIPKKEFMQNITPAISKRLKDRRLVVVDGFTDDERERYGVNYTDGELLSANIYYKLLSMGEDEVVSIFKKACFRHRQIIASLYIDAYMAGDNRVNQPFMQRLNEISKADDKDGMFRPILKDMIAALNEQTDG